MPDPSRWLRNLISFFLAIAIAIASPVATPEPQAERLAASHLPTGPTPVCGNPALQTGPAVPPAGAVTVPAGDNRALDFSGEGRIFWFAPGVHTLGASGSNGIRPAARQKFIGAPGAVLDGQARNLHAFVGNADAVEIRYLKIQNFGTGADNFNEGVVNHDAGKDWQILNNEIVDNDGAGVMLGSGNVVKENCLRDNGQYGFNAFSRGGLLDLAIERNEIAGNNADDWENRIEGCGCTGGGKIWDSTGVKIVGNWIHANHSVGLWADTNNADVIVEQNWIELNYGEGVIYEISQNATIRGNVFLRNNIPKGAERYATDRSFPSATIFLSGAGGDPRLPSTLTGSAQILVEGNLLQDNWGGITEWEDSNRFCGSPANTSVGYCPRGSSASLRTCIPGMIDDEPYRTDCRWRTSSTTVRDNDFKVAPGSVPGCNARIVMVDEGAHQLLPCAMMALVASVGTEPSWSPYLGSVVQDAIVFRQRNVWLENRYHGPWTFSAGEPGTYLTFATWRSGPFNQDRLSSLQ